MILEFENFWITHAATKCFDLPNVFFSKSLVLASRYKSKTIDEYSSTSRIYKVYSLTVLSFFFVFLSGGIFIPLLLFSTGVVARVVPSRHIFVLYREYHQTGIHKFSRYSRTGIAFFPRHTLFLERVCQP